jgi:hypothetical protein
MSSYMTFDNTGMPYDPTQIVTDGVFDLAKYEAYSPAFIPATLAVAYGVAFAAFASVVVHTARKSSTLCSFSFLNTLLQCGTATIS